ncbi:MAG TPA: DUF4286 family protein [Candidatus Sulfotelmatobacter sp.]|nr:DUF4286 family protein [Candidatus Sulfotelmatobacter sp.]
MAKGILIAAFDYSTAHEDEFHDWYDLEHVPERERVPGFLQCRRWLGEPKIALATYDLETVDVMRSAPYKAIAYDNLSVWSKRVTAMCKRILRFEGEQTLPGDKIGVPDAGAILMNAMNVDPAHEADFNAWYDQEHIPQLAAVPGCLLARRFRATDDGSHKYIALYHLKSADVQESAAWKKAVDTPWSARIRPHYKDRVRLVCRRYVRQASAARAAE